MKSQQQKRPVFLNLFKIHLPVTGYVSIAHRISGAFLILALPVLLYLLERSLSGPDGFAQVTTMLADPEIKLVALVGVWAIVHHFLAGIRFLLSDLHVGVALRPARASAWAVNLGGIVLAFYIWGTWIL
ncbi:MAG TPA: succinate dehydrogenase, cytochrome b556 subunit [Gammaproteobacteria bacterium]|nr:succinate dehydrogenase, cytochrome b556 subunit [Gammaproteobacteria bacterium]